MKLLFASDIHGSELYCKELCRRIEEEIPDKIVLLGDLLYHGPRNDLPHGYAPKQVISLLNAMSKHIIAVRGNCDSEVDQMVLDFPCLADYTTLLLPNGKIVFATHGHLWTPEDTDTLGTCDVFVSGHTHIKQLVNFDKTLVLNPGSVALPKDDCRSYAIYEDDIFAIKTLDGSPLHTVQI